MTPAAPTPDGADGVSLPPVTSVGWAEAEAGMQTGDLLVFAGTEKLSRWIETLTGGPFSHAATIYRPDPGAPAMLWQEAPVGLVADPRTGRTHSGAQLGDALGAAQAIRAFGDVAWYVPLEWERPPGLPAAMEEVLSTYEERPFGTVLEMALDYAVGRLHNQSTGDSVLYCAALVATTYMAIGALDTTHPANWYSPNSFSAAQSPGLPWTAGAHLGVPVQVALPPGGPAASVGSIGDWPCGPLAPGSLAEPPSI